MSNPETAPALVRVKVKTDTHEHAGQPCKRGQTIAVTPDQVPWLVEHGVIDPPKHNKEN